MLKITLEMLEHMGACAGQRELFAQVFPNDAKLTLKDLQIAKNADLNVGWFLDYSLSSERFVNYRAERWAIYNACNTFGEREKLRAKLYIKYVNEQIEENQAMRLTAKDLRNANASIYIYSTFEAEFPDGIVINAKNVGKVRTLFENVSWIGNRNFVVWVCSDADRSQYILDIDGISDYDVNEIAAKYLLKWRKENPLNAKNK